jgi:hypothetical protein
MVKVVLQGQKYYSVSASILLVLQRNSLFTFHFCKSLVQAHKARTITCLEFCDTLSYTHNIVSRTPQMQVGYATKLYGCTWYVLEISSQCLSYDKTIATSKVSHPVSLRSPSSCLLLRARLPISSIFPSIKSCVETVF